MNQQPEYLLQKAVAEYLRRQYPKVLFLSDVKAALKLNIRQAVRLKALQKVEFKCPDVLIFEPRRGYHGMFQEIKVRSPFRRDGSIKTDEHLQAQAATIEQLRERGYHAAFYWDFETIKAELDWYLGE